MAKNSEIVIKEEDPKAPRFVFPFFPNFKFDLPFLKPNPSKPVEASGKAVERRTSMDEGTGNETAKPSFVRFPKTQLVVPPPMETEAEESAKTSNPIIIWQVYALGAILVSRWVWARWNERKPKGRNPNDDNDQNRPPSDVNNEGRPFDNE
ncbi:uncharacterized protein LOC129292638 [Prosopis cineraria]|uniref:uncharacterized protein LOC129292638 n=1 Tax=Prosopis cineraria TaxID=364024 RepID=UPI00240F9851|nr:uncharacterized protein LOC129292638 [Prosopis cineraria]